MFYCIQLFYSEWSSFVTLLDDSDIVNIIKQVPLSILTATVLQPVELSMPKADACMTFPKAPRPRGFSGRTQRDNSNTILFVSQMVGLKPRGGLWLNTGRWQSVRVNVSKGFRWEPPRYPSWPFIKLEKWKWHLLYIQQALMSQTQIPP